MRSVQCPRYGSMVLEDVPAPTPKDDEVVVQVVAASLNSADWHMLTGDPWPMRLALGLRRPRLKGLGADVAGRVIAVGSAARERFKVGDEVLAELSAHGFGGFADKVAAPASAWVHKPPALSFHDAAALPMAAVTALRGLRDVANVTQGQRVLVVGAGGGVGSFAVQLALSMGARVTAACGAAKVQRVASLGDAAVLTVIDNDALSRALQDGSLRDAFHVVLDAACYRSPFAFRAVLAPGGTYVLAGGSFAAIVKVGLLGALVGALTGRRFRGYLSIASAADLTEVLSLVSAGRVRPLLDERTFTLEETERAFAHLEGRASCGKVIIHVQ